MPGFNIDTTGTTSQNVLYADNVDFSGSTAPTPTVTTDGQLLIGASSGQRIRVNTLTSSDNTVTITNGAGTIDLTVTGGSGYISLSPFIVGDDTHSGYTTIQAAINAAQGAGATAASPLNVYIKPKSNLTAYTENLTVPAGINLIGFNPEVTQYALSPIYSVRIIGTITVSAAGAQPKFENFALLPTAGNNAFVISSTAKIFGDNLYVLSDTNVILSTGNAAALFSNCYLLGGSGNLINDNGTATTASLYMTNCTTTGAISMTSAGGTFTLKADTSTIAGSASLDNTHDVIDITNSTISLPSGFTTGAGTDATSYCRMSNSYFPQGFQISLGTSTFEFSATDSFCITGPFTIAAGTATFAGGYFSNTSAICFTVSVGATLNLANMLLNSSAANVITGGGTVKISNVNFSGSSSGISTTTQSVLVNMPGAKQVKAPAGDYTVLATDGVVLATSSAARAIALNSSPATGQSVTIKDVTGSAATNNITITPAAGNIDGSGTFVINANYGSVTLVYNGTQWNVI